jgi:hypothetical protein
MWNCLRPVSLPLEIEVIARIDDVLSIAQNEIEVKDLLQPECGDFCLRRVFRLVVASLAHAASERFKHQTQQLYYTQLLECK